MARLCRCMASNGRLIARERSPAATSCKCWPCPFEHLSCHLLCAILAEHAYFGGCRGARDAAPKQHVGRELNSGYMKVVRAHKWWHGSANCSSSATFTAAGDNYISINTIRASHQVNCLRKGLGHLPNRVVKIIVCGHLSCAEKLIVPATSAMWAVPCRYPGCVFKHSCTLHLASLMKHCCCGLRATQLQLPTKLGTCRISYVHRRARRQQCSVWNRGATSLQESSKKIL